MEYITAVLFFCIAKTTNSLIINGTIPDIASMYPNSRKCSAIPTKTINGSQIGSCCQPCSCASDCYMVGNCCPDVPQKNFSEPKYPCVEVSQLFNTERKLKYGQYFDLWFHVIDSCPDNHTDETFQACKRPFELKDFVMVSDKSAEKVYKNRQCAMCHGVQDFVIWDTYTPCADIVFKSFESFEERNKFVLSECPLISLPPDKRILEKTRCYTDLNTQSTCVVSGVSDELKEACETKRPTQNTVFFVSHKSGSRLRKYANIYCYLCNYPEQSPVIDFCQLDEISHNKNRNLISFSGLLNLHTDVEATTESVKCGSIDIWDSFDKICRPLFCQGGNFPVYGICMDTLVDSKGYTISLSFYVTINIETKFSKDLLNFLADELYRIAGRHFFCGQCGWVMYTSKNMSEHVFETPLYTTEHCSTKKLIAYVDMLDRKKEIKLQYEEKSERIALSLKVTFDNPTVRYTMRSFRNKACPEKFHIDRITLQNCPRIELSQEESSKLNIGQNNTSRRALLMNELTNKTSICVEKYFHLRQQEQNEQNTSSSQKKWHFFAALSLLICSLLQKVLM